MFIVNSNKTYTKKEADKQSLIQRVRSGYVRVKSINLECPVPPTETIEGTFQLTR